MNTLFLLHFNTCWGLVDQFWETISKLTDLAISKSWLVFSIALFCGLLHNEYKSRVHGDSSLAEHFKTLSKAIGIAFFLSYYTPILEYFDGFIEFCFLSEDSVIEASGRVSPENSSFWWDILVFLGDFISDPLSMLTRIFTQSAHFFAIRIMHYVKVFILIFLTLVGPFAAVGTLFPGFMRSNFSGWAKSYVNISCWGITLNILGALCWLHQENKITYAGSVAHVGISIVLFITIFMTPTITNYFIGSVMIPNLGGVSNKASSVGRKAVGLAMRFIKPI